ncbi:septum formation protein Maf [Patescibacteria group bacterium]|nr:septum formation protein Maf [Patescibacteria group bacterium]
MSRLIILASKSPQRKSIMQALRVEFKVVPADINEQAVSTTDPEKRAALIAQNKAKFVQKSFPQDIIVAADTYIVLNGQILEKPQTLAEAREMLVKQSGQIATELTGFCYLDPVKDIKVVKTVAVEVEFRHLSNAEIDHYIAAQPVMTWSAAFCPAYDSGASLIKRISGSLTGFTHGLPLEELIPLLQQSKVLKI